tara:strand:+ start:1 stop:1056 length:1056 start_codon:yes stop_codon:yes gene_type:complete
MVPFAGYSLPIQYETGIIAEHIHTRKEASIFDVSHMGQIKITGPMIYDAMERILPVSFSEMYPGQIKYSQFLNEEGKIIDDLMVYKSTEGDYVWLVVNADCIEKDLNHLNIYLNENYSIELIQDRSLIALQGPESSNILCKYFPDIEDIPFMSAGWFDYKGQHFFISRCGYTGEDGFEISIKDKDSESFVSELLKNKEIKLAGLGARNSLRMEAGLCLYGNDININISPVEAGINWSISKERIENGNFLGHEHVKSDITNGVSKKLIGLNLLGKLPAREGVDIFNLDKIKIGIVTSGGYSPTLKAPIAMGYISEDNAKENDEVLLSVRGRLIPASITNLPFVKHNYFRGKK